MPRNVSRPQVVGDPKKQWRAIGIMFGLTLLLLVSCRILIHVVAPKPQAQPEVQADNRPPGPAYLQSFSDLKAKYGLSEPTYNQKPGVQHHAFSKIEGIMRLAVDTDGDHVESIEYDLNHQWTTAQLVAALNANGTGWQEQRQGISASLVSSFNNIHIFRSQEGHLANFNGMTCQLRITSAELTQMQELQKEQQQHKNAQMPRF